jgi:hypothetical protein
VVLSIWAATPCEQITFNLQSFALIRVKNSGQLGTQSNTREYRGTFLDQGRSHPREMILTSSVTPPNDDPSQSIKS